MRAGGPPVDFTNSHPGIGADGGIVSSAKDTARFLVALMHGELLRPATLERMKGDALWSGGELTTCGIGYGWSGGGAAYKTNALVSGDGDRVAVLLLNGRGSPSDDQVAGSALTTLYCAA
jgi:D-alanyl-D-alanine carboxypeptidase